MSHFHVSFHPPRMQKMIILNYFSYLYMDLHNWLFLAIYLCIEWNSIVGWVSWDGRILLKWICISYCDTKVLMNAIIKKMYVEFCWFRIHMISVSICWISYFFREYEESFKIQIGHEDYRLGALSKYNG